MVSAENFYKIMWEPFKWTVIDMLKMADQSGLKTDVDPIQYNLHILDEHLEEIGVTSWDELNNYLTREEFITGIFEILKHPLYGVTVTDEQILRFVDWLEKNSEPRIAELVLNLHDFGMDNYDLRMVIIWVCSSIDLMKERESKKYRSVYSGWRVD